jgi:hypothetical protein
MKCTIFLREVINKFNFISKHFSYNIHFLNTVSVRSRPLLSTHSCKRFWKFCITRCSMVGEIAATSSLMFCFKSNVVLGLFSYTLLFRDPQRQKSQAHAARNAMRVLKDMFPARVISRRGTIEWPARSPDLNACD